MRTLILYVQMLRLAKEVVKDELRRAKFKISQFKASEINNSAKLLVVANQAAFEEAVQDINDTHTRLRRKLKASETQAIPPKVTGDT